MYNGPAMTTQPATDAAPVSSACPKNPSGSAHHWLLDGPHGAVVHGQCRHCGEERDFDNSLAYQPAEDTDALAPTILERIRKHRGPPLNFRRPGMRPAGSTHGPGPRLDPKKGQDGPIVPVNKLVNKAEQVAPLPRPGATTASGNQSLGAGGGTPKGGSMGLRKRTEAEVLEVVKRHGRISPAAAELGTAYATLYEYMRRRQMDPEQYQPGKQKRKSAGTVPVSARGGDLGTIMQELVRLGRRVDRLTEALTTPHFHVRYEAGKLVFECTSEQDCEMVRKLLKEQQWVVREG